MKTLHPTSGSHTIVVSASNACGKGSDQESVHLIEEACGPRIHTAFTSCPLPVEATLWLLVAPTPSNYYGEVLRGQGQVAGVDPAGGAETRQYRAVDDGDSYQYRGS